MATRLTDTPPSRTRAPREAGRPRPGWDGAPPRVNRRPRPQDSPRGQAGTRAEAGTRAGTRSQPGARTVPRPAPGRAGAPPRPAARPVTAPRPAAPRRGVNGQPGRIDQPTRTAPPTRATPASTRPDQASARRRRMPFLLLVVGMLAGTLVGLLVISTTLAAGSFRITTLQKQNQALAKQQQQLQQQVAQDQAPSVIAQRAEQLGLQPVKQLEFLNIKTGKVSSNTATGSTARIQVPGYTP